MAHTQVTVNQVAGDSAGQPYPCTRPPLSPGPSPPPLVLYPELPSKAREPGLHVAVADGKVAGARVNDAEGERLVPADRQLQAVQVDTHRGGQRVVPVQAQLQLQHAQAQGWQADGHRHL
jgi:hypothetical protein